MGVRISHSELMLKKHTVVHPDHRHCDICEYPHYMFWMCEKCAGVFCDDHKESHDGKCTYPKYWYEVYDD